MILTSGYSAFRLIIGSNPADLYGWDDQYANLLFAQGPCSGQLAQQWKLRIMAQEAAWKLVANSKLQRLLAYKMTSKCADAMNRDSVPFYKAPNRKSTRMERTYRILEIDGTAMTVRRQS